MAPQPQPPWHADQTLDVNGQIRLRSFALATLDAAGQPVWEHSDSWTEYSTLHAELGVVNAHHRLDSNGRHTTTFSVPGSRGGTLAVQTVHPDSSAETRRYWLDSNGNVTWTGRRYYPTFPAPGELGTLSIHDLHNRLVRHEDLLTGVLTEYTYAPDLPDGSVSRNTATVVTTSGEGLVSSEEYIYHPSTDPPATRFKLMDHIRHTPSGAITLEHHTYVTADPHPQNIGRPARVDYADGSYEEYTYSCCGLLTSRRRDGGITTHAYDDHGRLSSTTDPLGGVTSFGYTGLSSRQASITNDFGVVESFTYDGQGRRVRTDYTNGPLDGRHELSHYRADGRLSWSRSHSGVVTSNAYDTTTGDLLAVYVDGQLERSQTYDTLGRVETTTDARGLTLTRFYDTQGRLTHIIWPDSTFTETSYNAFGRVEYSNDRAGYTTWYEYDSMGRRTLVTPPDGIQRKTTYRPSGEVEFTSIRPSTGEPALITGYEYDPLGRTSRIILPDGRERSYGYPDSFTRVETNEFGEVITHVTAPGGASSWTLSSLGLVQSNRVSRGVGYVDYLSTGPDGRATTNRVSQSGAHARTFYPDGGQSTVESGPFGPVRLVARDGAVTLRGYDPRGRLLTETNAVSDVLTYAYNSAGDLTDLWDWKGNHTQWQYDAEGRMAHKIYADGTQHDYTYHPAGTLESRTDALDRVTTYQYEFGRLKHIDYPSDPDVHYLYTPYGQPDTITRDASASQPAATLQYGYDLHQNRASETSSFSSSLPVTLQYAGSRLLGYQVDDALPVAYQYDPVGRVSTVSRGTDTFTHTYDGQSARIAEITRNGLLHVHNQYDAMGRLDTRLNFASGQPVPDRSALFDYVHDAGDRRASVARADGSRIDYAYDPLGQVTGAVGVFDGGLTNRAYRFSYDYDPAGNPLERVRNGARREFVSNNLNQLTSATSAAAVDVSGRFDGPIASVTVNTTPGAFLGDRWWAEQVSIAPGTNQLAAVITPPAAPAQTNTLSIVNAPAEVFQYDLNGCMTSSGAWTNIWDEENRLIETAPANPAPGGLKVVNQYDPLSRRTVKQVFVCTAPGQWTLVREHRFTWIDWLMVREYVTDMPQGLPPLQTVRDYVWGVDLSGTLQGAGAVGGLLAVVSTTAANPQPAVYYPGYDGNGNVCSATDAAGALAAAFEYDPFGNLLSAEGPAAAQIPFRFSTKYTDAETRLVYYGFRYYAPEIGRWPNRDPIGERGGAGIYSFVLNNPIHAFDKLGLLPSLCKCRDDQKPADDIINNIFRDLIGSPEDINVKQNILDKIHGKGSLTLTALDRQINKLIESDSIDAVTCNCEVRNFYGKPIASAPALKLCGRCVGVDKLVHFLEEGAIYHDISMSKGKEYALAWGYWTEGLMYPGMTQDIYNWLRIDSIGKVQVGGVHLGFGNSIMWAGYFGDRDVFGAVLDPNGSASPADLAANESGLKFYEDIKAMGAEFKFDICHYVNDKWDHRQNKNVPGFERLNPPVWTP